MHEREQLPSVADEQTRRAQTRVGQLVRGRWRLDSLLGVGGMAAVYAATHRNGKRVALKMLHGEVSTNTEVRQRFIDEGYAANRVGHSGAVSVIDDDVAEDGSAFLVMDLLEGETLETRLHRRGKLWPGEVLPITHALLDILAAAHERGIVHRDIKPDNVFVTREGKVKLLDFGIARMVQPGRPRTTQSGATMGTPSFMPPEQARGRWEELDGRTDLWAVGATMFIQLTGSQVRQADTANEELLLAMTTPVPSLGELRPDLPKPLIDLVDKALAFEQHNRWPNARVMQAAVRSVQEHLGAEGFLPIASESARIGFPTDSDAPVTLATPRPAAVSTSFRRTLTARRRGIGLVGLGAAAAFIVLLVLTQRVHRRSAEVSRSTASTPRGTVEPSEKPSPIDPSVNVLVTPAPLAPEPGDVLEAPAKSPTILRKLKFEKSPAAKPGQPRPRTDAKPAVGSLPPLTPSPAIAPQAEPQLPSSADPLERRR